MQGRGGGGGAREVFPQVHKAKNCLFMITGTMQMILDKHKACTGKIKVKSNI